MPLPSDMSACMRKVKKEFPSGRSDKKKGKKSAHQQHVAMCLQAAGKSKKEGVVLTFKQFLMECE